MEEKKDICSAIISDAELYAESVVKAAEEYAEEKRKEADFQVKTFALGQDELSRKECDDVAAKNAAAERMEKKKIVLAAKVSLIDEVYERLKAKLYSLSGVDLERFTAGLIEKYASFGDEIVVAADSALSVEKIAALPVAEKLGLKVSGGGDFSGGFAIKSKSFDRDFSFASIVRSVKEQTESEVSAKLFG